ncbi:MAG TPA: rhomboid family intramembrane serine protease [Pirellulales bacterium]|nr:rhomboid family intramembrane serine protease [Pirellulales bacterium]
MIIPWNTDAPLYHPPIATVGMIAVNTIIHLCFVMPADDLRPIEPWMLEFGDGLHPLQWVTANFLHANLLHLLGNMIFLWAFGLVVEGKLGWLRFLVTYIGIGVVESAMEQVCMLGADKGGALGASGAIYGLLAISMVWAPENEMSCLLLVSFRVVTFEISIAILAGLYILIEIVTSYFEGFRMSSAVLHLSGSLVGFVWGTLLVKTDRVDCEGWDLYSVIAGRGGKKSKKKRVAKTPAQEKAAALQREARAKAVLDQVQNLLAQGNARGAHALAKTSSRALADWQLPEEDSLKLIAALDKERAWPEAIDAMVDFLRRFPDKSARVRLKLAQVLTREEKRPAQALKVLAKLPGNMPPQLEQLRKQLSDQAAKMQGQGAMELAAEDW